jgi:hypothetical protein
LKDLSFEFFQWRMVEFHRGKNAGGIEPGLKAGVDTVVVHYS